MDTSPSELIFLDGTVSAVIYRNEENGYTILRLETTDEGEEVTVVEMCIRDRKITTEALALNATVVVLAHNHPSGLATPSQEDLFLTRYIQDSLKPLGITLYDHVILTDDDMVSLRDSRYLTPL